jgi:hypothetical protein
VSEVPSAEQYAAAFRAAGDLPDTYRKMLRFQYQAPRRSVTPRQIAYAVGYKNYNPANLHYGKLGKRIGEQLDWYPGRHYFDVLSNWEFANEEVHWTMRPQVAQALEQLGWVGPNGPPPPPPPPDRVLLNVILYGPPGTGKTYSTQRKAVEIIEPSSGSSLSSEEVGEKFREHREQEKIEFVTFHPSYSYEEFVEGFRYDEDKKVPVLNRGIFEEMCRRAEGSDDAGVEAGGRVWKVSLGERQGDQGIFERCMENREIAVGWLDSVDLTDANSERVSELFREHHPGSKAQSTN